MLAFITGDARFHETATEAMRYLAADAVALQPLSAGVLLAQQDMTEAPLHVTIVGARARPRHRSSAHGGAAGDRVA